MLNTADAPRALIGRRFAALGYDWLIGLAVYMAAGTVLFGLFALLVAFGFVDDAGATHTVDIIRSNPVWFWFNELGKIAAVIALVVWSWRRKGQTLGMRAWRLRVQQTDGSVVSTRQALLRVVTSFAGLASISLLFSLENRGWQDKLSGTEVVMLTIEQNRSLMNHCQH